MCRAIYHATQTVLEPLDRSLDIFLRDIQLDARSAFLGHNMAPLSMRRDIAMLGFLHKRMLGDTHGDICSLLPLFLEPEARRCTRFRSDRPSRLFQEPFDGTRPALIRCSVAILVQAILAQAIRLQILVGARAVASHCRGSGTQHVMLNSRRRNPEAGKRREGGVQEAP